MSFRFGFVVLALLVAGAAASLLLHSPSGAAAGGERPVATPSTDVFRFRRDLWHLPDEPLLGFVEIPAGAFLMGSDRSRDRRAYDNETWSATQAQGKVGLPTYYMQRYEVTVAQFAAFVADANHHVDPASLRGEADYPVTYVAWTDALAYCRWLQNRLRNAPTAPAAMRDLLNAGWRITLPTEAQWEKAARGTDGRLFPWGSAPMPGKANIRARALQAVGSFDCPECSFGLADMSGNVWELTRSPFQPYPFDAANVGDINREALWVMRGGSYRDEINNVRAAARGGVDPGVRNGTIGFRIALVAP